MIKFSLLLIKKFMFLMMLLHYLNPQTFFKVQPQP